MYKKIMCFHCVPHSGYLQKIDSLIPIFKRLNQFLHKLSFLEKDSLCKNALASQLPFGSYDANANNDRNAYKKNVFFILILFSFFFNLIMSKLHFCVFFNQLLIPAIIRASLYIAFFKKIVSFQVQILTSAIKVRKVSPS